MDVVFQSIMIGCLVILSACAIVFPTLFLVQFSHFRKEIKNGLTQMNQQKQGENQKEE